MLCVHLCAKGGGNSWAVDEKRKLSTQDNEGLVPISRILVSSLFSFRKFQVNQGFLSDRNNVNGSGSRLSSYGWWGYAELQRKFSVQWKCQICKPAELIRTKAVWLKMGGTVLLLQPLRQQRTCFYNLSKSTTNLCMNELELLNLRNGVA